MACKIWHRENRVNEKTFSLLFSIIYFIKNVFFQTEQNMQFEGEILMFVMQISEIFITLYL